jgi:hypothetical protein
MDGIIIMPIGILGSINLIFFKNTGSLNYIKKYQLRSLIHETDFCMILYFIYLSSSLHTFSTVEIRF